METYKLLIVDDEPDNLALLYRTLRKDYDIEKTTSPLEALEILKSGEFQCILSDHKMPEMDGVEFLQKSQELSPESMRLMITAYTDSSILIKAINDANIYRYVKKPYDPEELKLTVKGALEYWQLKSDNKALIKELKDLFSGTITAIVEALDAKDTYTLGRSRRVTFYAIKMANAMNLDDSIIGKIELAGLLHDIGMVGISDDVLMKKDKLTQEEYESVKQHVSYSVKILGDIKQLKDVIEIVKYHHEHVDGNGYPYGKKGEEIPVGSRILAVADAFDSMVTLRTYRERITPREAIKRIKEAEGTQFDADVVKAFEKILPQALVELRNRK